MEPDDLLCSRNARPQKDAREQADRSSCSQSPHDKTVVARCAQWGTQRSHSVDNIHKQAWQDYLESLTAALMNSLLSILIYEKLRARRHDARQGQFSTLHFLTKHLRLLSVKSRTAPHAPNNADTFLFPSRLRSRVLYCVASLILAADCSNVLST